MSKKPNAKQVKKAHKKDPMTGAMKFFLGGCFAELYLLVIRRFYLSGTLEQVVAWDGYLSTLVWVGLAVLAVGAVLAVLWWKSQPKRRPIALWVAAAGAFVALASWLSRAYLTAALTPLCILVPGVMLLGILWTLYDRECAWALTLLAGGLAAVWICRKGVGNLYWNSLAMVCGVVFILLMLACIFLAKKAAVNGGFLGKVRVLDKKSDLRPICGACAISALATAAALFSSALAYYALWALAAVIFALAVYYTIKQL